jgi:hypothetical protein
VASGGPQQQKVHAQWAREAGGARILENTATTSPFRSVCSCSSPMLRGMRENPDSGREVVITTPGENPFWGHLGGVSQPSFK